MPGPARPAPAAPGGGSPPPAPFPRPCGRARREAGPGSWPAGRAGGGGRERARCVPQVSPGVGKLGTAPRPGGTRPGKERARRPAGPGAGTQRVPGGARAGRGTCGRDPGHLREGPGLGWAARPARRCRGRRCGGTDGALAAAGRGSGSLCFWELFRNFERCPPWPLAVGEAPSCRCLGHLAPKPGGDRPPGAGTGTSRNTLLKIAWSEALPVERCWDRCPCARKTLQPDFLQLLRACLSAGLSQPQITF